MSDFCLSIDLELGVGIDHFKTQKKIDPAIERKAVPRILNLANRYDVPITFAVCGHLLLRECNGHDIPRPSPPFYDGDWYKNDPKSRFPENMTWYAPDIVEEIIKNEHEIACHTFSHISFKYCGREVAEAEIKECITIAKDWDLELETFVFPRNEINYLDLLEKYDFKYFVSNPQPTTWRWGLPKMMRITELKSAGKLTEIPRTYYLNLARQRDMFKIYGLLALAKTNNALFHVWTHTWCLASDEYFSIIEKMFKFVNKFNFRKLKINDVGELRR